jgi:4-oxalocrotonate tautomerase
VPLVRVDLMVGRPRELYPILHERLAQVVSEVLDAPIESVRTYITEIPPENWGIAGVPASIAKADVIEARRRAQGDASNSSPARSDSA